jgi:aminoglycoside phosphotransferase (APT) family kinase protein
MSATGSAGLVTDEVRAWVGSITDDAVAAVDELTGGASRNSFILTARSGRKYFLRMDAGHGPLSGTPFTLDREYGVLEYLKGRGVPIPGVLAWSAVHNAVLMEFVPGHTSYQRIGPEAEEAQVRRELIAAVVALQSIPTRDLKVLGDYCGEPLKRAIPADLGIWRVLYDRRVTIRDPLVEFSFNWLSQSVPDADSPPVIVHGDVGPGNFIVDDGHVRALIDWELVRVGHPLEDVACIIARALGAPFGRPEEHIANYESLSGRRVDRATLDYALALILTRWLVGMLMALSRPSALQNIPMLFAFRQLNGAALVEALCRRYEVVPQPIPAVVAGEACSIVFKYSADCLQALSAQAHFTTADRYKLSGIADLMAYLRSFVSYGPERYDREYLERAAQVLGRRVSTPDDANDALCAHAREVDVRHARPLVELFAWWYSREHSIMYASLGKLADNRINFGAGL